MQIEPSTAEPKRERRWFQFSLRTLMVFTLVVAVACAWLGSKIERKRREWEAAKAIAKSSGTVTWDHQRVNGQQGQWQPAGAEPFGPSWLRGLLGENFFSDVDHIACVAGADNLKEFPHLRSLQLVSWGITDDGLDVVKGLKEFRNLALIDTMVSDAAVQDLHATLPNCYITVIHQMPPQSRKDYPPINTSGAN